MSAYREFTGKSVEEALRNAREAFGAGLEDLDFEILTPGSRGVLGMGAEQARIVAAPRSALGGAAPKRDAAASQPLPPAPRRDDSFSGADRDRGPRPGGYSDGDRGPRPTGGGSSGAGAPYRGPRPDDRGPRPDDRGPRPDDRGPAPARPAVPMEQQGAESAFGSPDRGAGRESAPYQDRGPRPQGGLRPDGARSGQGGRGDRREGQPRPSDRGPAPAGRPPAAREGARPGGRFDMTASEVDEVNAARGSLAAERADLEAAEASPEALKAGQEILEQLMKHLGFDVRVEVDSGETSRLNVVGEGDEKEALGALIGRKGERLSALQHLVNLMLSRKMDAWTRVLVDVEDYRGRRERQLRDLAERAAERVIETGKMLQLEPMPALERRWIHIALRDHPAVGTQSIGEEPNRRVVVVPRTI